MDPTIFVLFTAVIFLLIRLRITSRQSATYRTRLNQHGGPKAPKQRQPPTPVQQPPHCATCGRQHCNCVDQAVERKLQPIRQELVDLRREKALLQGANQRLINSHARTLNRLTTTQRQLRTMGSNADIQQALAATRELRTAVTQATNRLGTPGKVRSIEYLHASRQAFEEFVEGLDADMLDTLMEIPGIREEFLTIGNEIIAKLEEIQARATA